ncbi:MAG: hypothetical protein JO300_08505 [Silvibacterium sp.]|nr:hypothetical protein [Silvibacterium sp.]
MTDTFAPADQSFATLRRFARARTPLERCELCSAALAEQHPHLVDPASRNIVCACDPCAMLFDGRTRGKYRRVSRSVRLLAAFRMTEAQWENLLIPINMAFFFRSSVSGGVTVLYPSPAGAVESLLPLDAWDEIVEDNPVLNHLQPDIEALLVNRIQNARAASHAEYYIAPIDQCYGLVGQIRANWKGLSGGAEVWEGIARFFDGLRSQAEIVTGEAHA